MVDLFPDSPPNDSLSTFYIKLIFAMSAQIRPSLYTSSVTVCLPPVKATTESRHLRCSKNLTTKQWHETWSFPWEVTRTYYITVSEASMGSVNHLNQHEKIGLLRIQTMDLRFSIWQKPNAFQVDDRKRCFQRIFPILSVRIRNNSKSSISTQLYGQFLVTCLS